MSKSIEGSNILFLCLIFQCLSLVLGQRGFRDENENVTRSSTEGLNQKENQRSNVSVDDFSFFDEGEWAADRKRLEEVGQKPSSQLVTELPREEGPATQPPSEPPVSATTTERVTTTTTTTASSVKERPCVFRFSNLPKSDCDGQLERTQKNLEDAMGLLKVRP